MRAHYLQHVPFEGLGSIENWLRQNSFSISCTRFFEEGELPNVGEIDLLVIMGGPMSVNDVARYPWLDEETAFIREAIGRDIPILGICLGAQLIASSLGAKVYPNPEKEIGWFPIKAVEYDDNNLFRFPGELEVFHWHGETFDLPPGAVLLAESDGCAVQAFQFGNRVIGLQFHLETTPASARAIIDNCRHELTAGPYIQREADMLSVPQQHYLAIHRVLADMLEYLLH